MNEWRSGVYRTREGRGDYCVGTLIRLQGSKLVTLCISCLEGNSRNSTYYLYVFAISKYVQGVLNYPP